MFQFYEQSKKVVMIYLFIKNAVLLFGFPPINSYLKEDV